MVFGWFRKSSAPPTAEEQFQEKIRSLVQETLQESETEFSNRNLYQDEDGLYNAMRRAGVESSNLIVGLDFTQSNKTGGRKSFGGRSLHAIEDGRPNPYELVLGIIGDVVMTMLDEDGLVPAFVFGDLRTRAREVRQLGPASGCTGIRGAGSLLEHYRKDVASASLSGPTSFAPLINRAVQIVRNHGNSFHILLILADGAVSPECLAETKAALVRASEHPLSIVLVGIGDGPWEDMHALDDDVSDSRFDNFQFVCFARFQELLEEAEEENRRLVNAAFAVCALQEIPAQYSAMRELGLLPSATGARACTGAVAALQDGVVAGAEVTIDRNNARDARSRSPRR